MKSRHKTQALLARLEKVECPDTTFFTTNFPIVMKRAQGLKVVDVDKKTYLDFSSCFGVLALGHTSHAVSQALKKQSKHLIHGMGDVHPSEEKIKLLELLAKISPYKEAKSLLGLSGGDAVEAALKTALLATNRSQFLSLCDGYHGLQFAPLTLNNRQIFTSGFESWLKQKSVTLDFPYFPGNILCEEQRPEFKFFQETHHLAHQDEVLTKLEDELKTKKFAAFVLEPIQGRGGKRELGKDFLQACALLCKQYGTLLVFDEVFTGFGRTGKMFAQEHSQVVPDLMCVGKALGGGLPLSACIGEILDVWGKSTGEARHTQTFLGHPLACAVGYQTILEIRKKMPKFQNELNLIENEFLNFTNMMIKSGLYKQFPFEIRGRGFMRGLWFYSQKEGFCVDLMFQLLDRGFIVLPEGPRGDVLSLTPPLITQRKDIKKLLNELYHILSRSCVS